MARVSVVMAVYNGERYLREAIDSILGQTFADFEFLIVDDGSTDGTREILRSYADPRIRLMANERNLGLTPSLNRGLLAARGEFVARQDADDLSEPRRFEKQVDYLDSHPEVALLGSWAVSIDAHGTAGQTIELPGQPRDLRWALFFHSPFVHSAVMLRRAVVAETTGLYDQALSYAMDYDLWSRIAREHAVANLPEILVRYRVHESSMTMTHQGAAAEFSRLRIQRLAPRLGWQDQDRERSEARRAAMTALHFGWELRVEPTDLKQAVEDLFRLHDAFCREEGLHPDEVARREAALRARVGANLVLLAGFCRPGGLPARWELLALAHHLCPRVFLRPRTLGHAARVIVGVYASRFRATPAVGA